MKKRLTKRNLKFGTHCQYGSTALLYIGRDWTGDAIAVGKPAFGSHLSAFIFKGHTAALKLGWKNIKRCDIRPLLKEREEIGRKNRANGLIG